MQNTTKQPSNRAARNEQAALEHEGLLSFAEEVGQLAGRLLAVQERECHEQNQTSNRTQTGRTATAV